MPKARGRKDASSNSLIGGGASVNIPLPAIVDGVEYTGRHLVLFHEDSQESDVRNFSSVVGVRGMVRANDFKGGSIDLKQATSADAVYFDDLKVAVLNAAPDQVARVTSLSMASGTSMIAATEPERINHHFALEGFNAGYLCGYRDAVNHLGEKLLGSAPTEGAATGLETMASAPQFKDTHEYTWGIQATRVQTSKFAGKGIKVAVLDTGLDFQHPDFAGRTIQRQSFVVGEEAQDGLYHGTHCVGTSCGPKSAPPRRYGCAFEAEIYVGKVLDNKGNGPDQCILAGLNWAITNGCRIVSISLGTRVKLGEGPSPIYEQVAQRALAHNTLIIAAAGNFSNRPNLIVPVSRPANCPSVMAVAAVDSMLGIASFSCGGLNPDGGNIDIAAPGLSIFSSAPMPGRYRDLNGTSMAAPHVAGIAALWLEARPTLTASGLRDELISSALRMTLPARDVGAGLAQAPQEGGV